MSPVRDMLFITHESPVTVLAVSVRLHMSIISQDGGSALMLAAYEGHSEVVTQLLEAGANTDLLTTEVYKCICVHCSKLCLEWYDLTCMCSVGWVLQHFSYHH